jgi:isoquinoline 1-oxidoreductase beta subunit
MGMTRPDGGLSSGPASAPITRRRFLRASAAAGGGLLIAVALPGCGDRGTGDTPGSAKGGEDFAPNAFLRLDPDGTVTITVQRPELGQGVRTALAMIVAEELEADWRSVKVEQAGLDERLYGEQYAGGSDSVQFSWDLLRRAGATARELLVQAASKEWGVSAAECEARESRVLHGASGRSLDYGPLAVLASRGFSGEMPAAETLAASEPVLKSPGEYRLIGQRTPSLDGADIVTGRIRFGLDTRAEGMLVATVERCPVFGGRVQGFDAAAAEAVPGVRAVVGIDADAVEDFGPNNPKMANGVAVVAESTWAAMKGREALRIDWNPGPGAAESTEGFWRECEQLAGDPAQARIRDDGDFEGAMARAARRAEATYRVPYLAHTPMEPMNAIAHVTDGRCDVWAPCQNPQYVGAAAGKVTGLPAEAIHVHVVRSGGGFGRRFYADYAAEAVYLSQAVDAPVQVVWSREDDVRHGFYRPAGQHMLTAGLDPAGRPVAWRHFLANASRYAALGRGDDPREAGELEDFDFPAGLLPNLRFEYSQLESVVPRGQWRSVEPSANVWVIQSFLDELAHTAGRDPLEYQLDLIGPPREVPFYSRTYSTGRLRRVLELAAEKAGWGRPRPPGVGVGIAGSYSNSSYVAHVVEVSVTADGRVRIDRVVSAVDCGMVVNPTGAEAQVEGCIVYGLTAALYGEITIREGRAAQGNFDDYPALRIDETPRMEVHFVESDLPPQGMGEPPLPPLLPAFTNALFDATGERVRELPVRRRGS